MPGVRIIGTAEHKAAVLSFASKACIRTTSARLLNEEGVAIRTGHHCAQPVMQRFRVPATCARFVRVLQHACPKSMRWSRRYAKCRRCSHE